MKTQSMLEGSLWKKIFFFAMPLAASSILQQLFNAADSAVVGRFAGSEALAAVGANTPVTSLFINALVGLSIGANVVIAQYIGADNKKRIGETIQTAVLFSILGGIVIGIIGLVLADTILALIGTPDNVIGLGSLYLRIYFLGVPFISLFNFSSAIIRSSGDTKRPMYCLIIAGVLNIILNLILVIVFNLSVAGVAIATVISQIVSSCILTYSLVKEEGLIHLELKGIHLEKTAMIRILKTGAPASLQSMVFSLSNVCLQSGINSFGSNAIAGSATASNFEYFDYFMVNAFNQAAVTFIGQNFAAKKFDRCKEIYKVCMIESLIGILCMEAMFYVGRDQFISLYTTEKLVAGYALIRMYHCMIPHFLMNSYEITGSVLRGMGYSLLPALLTVIGSVGFRLVWLFAIFPVFNSFEMLLNVYPVSWILTGTMVITSYIFISKKAFH